jgi:hypothetical protein
MLRFERQAHTLHHKVGVVVAVDGVSIDDNGGVSTVTLFTFSITKLIWTIAGLYFLLAGLKPATLAIVGVIGLLAGQLLAFIGWLPVFATFILIIINVFRKEILQ